jgi:hypothetical protein
MPIDCVHVAGITELRAPGNGCEVCLQIGSTWVHLRQCLTCWKTLCCDDSPNRHMSAHNRETGHPVMRSVEPDEDWAWCYVDELMLRQADGRWESFDPFVETGTFFARRHLDRGGSLPIAADTYTAEGFPIGQWFRYIHEERAGGTLRERDQEAIEALPSWRWESAAPVSGA